LFTVAAPGVPASTSVTGHRPSSRFTEHFTDRQGAADVANQSERGLVAYRQSCSRCHRSDLSGDQSAPALIGDAFTQRWVGQSIGDLFDNIQTAMPMDNPSGLSNATFVDIVVYILRQNNYPVEGELTPDRDALKRLTITAK
jgi:mono/diheme cytochrome c family protein